MLMEFNGTNWIPRAALPGVFGAIHNVWPNNHLDKVTSPTGLAAGTQLQAFGFSHCAAANYGNLWYIDVTGNAWT
jgi:hypothetical protein